MIRNKPGIVSLPKILWSYRRDPQKTRGLRKPEFKPFRYRELLSSRDTSRLARLAFQYRRFSLRVDRDYHIPQRGIWL